MTEADPLQTWRRALTEGRFIIRQCRECAAHLLPADMQCGHCGSTDLKWVEPTGRGIVLALAGPGEPPDLALIGLEEGPQIRGRVIDPEPARIRIGMRVSAHVGLVDGTAAVVFYNKEQGSSEW